MSEPIGTIRSAHPPLAVLGGAPALAKPLPVGQLHFPAWSAYETAMRELFERQYYTNHGPLVQRFEAALRERLSVRHVVCVTNATIGLMMAVDALDLSGKVIVPAFTFIATVQAMSWAGLEPVFCDVDPATFRLEDSNLVIPIRGGAIAGERRLQIPLSDLGPWRSAGLLPESAGPGAR